MIRRWVRRDGGPGWICQRTSTTTHAAPVTKPCEVCGATFTCKALGKKRRYCSARCRNQAAGSGARDLSPEEIERRFVRAKQALRWARSRVQE